jgi:ATP-dependent Clp protease ATP-binding subunit ClpA
MFDEFTRAHRTVLEAVFQMLEEGRIMDAQGRVCDARQAFVFLASNVPVRLDPAANVIGFAAHSQQSAAPSAEQAIKDALVQHGLDPAFVNRIDYFVLFTPFSKQDLVRVVELITDDIVREQLKEKGLKLELSEDARAFLAGKGYSEQFGAKELRRVVREELMSPLGLQLREFASGDTILASLADGRLKFSKKPKPAQGAPGAAPPAAQPAAAPQGAAPAQPAAAPEAAAPAQPAGNAQPPPAAAAIR